MDTKGPETFTIINEPATCSNDVIELLSYKTASNTGRNYTLCKVLQKGLKSTQNISWVYMLILKDDEFPIVITKEYAKTILENPDIGAKLAYNTWLNRYR